MIMEGETSLQAGLGWAYSVFMNQSLPRDLDDGLSI